MTNVWPKASSFKFNDMNTKQIEVHKYYKSMHPEALILYHMPGQYILLGEDVERASKSISSITIDESGVATIPEDPLILSLLSEDGTEVQMISYRNDKGELDFPDVRRLKSEKEMDY